MFNSEVLRTTDPCSGAGRLEYPSLPKIHTLARVVPLCVAAVGPAVELAAAAQALDIVVAVRRVARQQAVGTVVVDIGPEAGLDAA